jgi:hypothetical protein
MQERYIEPELKLVGGVEEVVLGSTQIGTDFFGEQMPHSMEFETEESPIPVE